MKKDAIEIITNVPPETSQLLNLFRQTSWANNRNEDDVDLLLENTKIFVVIKVDQQLIGYGRAISDGVYRALLDDIVVHRDQRNNGVGTLIVKTLMDQLNAVAQVFLNTKPELETFYNNFGFSKSKCLTMNI